jgi:hypothetical protein
MNKKRKTRRPRAKSSSSTPRRRVRRSTAKRNPRPRRRRYARRNPRAISLKSITNDILMPGATMAVGGVAVDALYGVLPLPANLKTGVLGSLAKVVVAIGGGMVVGKFLGKKMGTAFALGGVVTQAYGFVKPQLQAMIPGLPMGEYLSEMVDPYSAGMGYVAPARFLPGADIAAPYSPQVMGEYLSGGYGGGGYGGY